MAFSREFSNVTKQYLMRFYEIRETMIHGMTDAALTDSISHNFIVQMIPHHEAAIEMSRNLLQYTTFVPLQNIAAGIVTMQTKSIADMRRVLACCEGRKNTEQDRCLYQQRFRQITEVMFREMGSACATNNINADFMREMIPHHRGAVLMSENALRYPICPELKPILNAIITSQEAGIREMNLLLRRCNG